VGGGISERPRQRTARMICSEKQRLRCDGVPEVASFSPKPAEAQVRKWTARQPGKRHWARRNALHCREGEGGRGLTCLCARPPLFIPSARIKVQQDFWPANVLSDVDATYKLSKETMTLFQTEPYTSNRHMQQRQSQMPPPISATTPQHNQRTTVSTACSARCGRSRHLTATTTTAAAAAAAITVGNERNPQEVGERTTERENLRRHWGLRMGEEDVFGT
jgi:hypothetical protein